MEQNNRSNPQLTFLSNLFTKIEKWIYAFKLPLLLGLSVILLLLPTFGFSQYLMRIFIVIGIYTMLALGLNILTGYTGLVSLGHGGFYAIGAYTTALLMLDLNFNFFPALVMGALFSGLCGLLLGLPTLRLSGTYLSIVTLGFGEIIKMIIMNWESVTNGTLGLKGIPRPTILGVELTLANHGIYYLMLALLFMVTLACALIIDSKSGRAFRAIKNDELAASMMGIQTTRFKILAFAVSTTITGLAGGFYGTLVGYIDHNSFSFDVSILILIIVILGGMGTLRGMFLGAVVLIALPEVARPLMDWRFVIYGFVLIIMMHFCPQGLLGWRSRLPYKLPSPKAKKGGVSDGLS